MVGQPMLWVVIAYWRPRTVVVVGQSGLKIHHTNHHPPGEGSAEKEYVGRVCVWV